MMQSAVDLAHSPPTPLVSARDADGVLAVMPSVYSVPFDETNTAFESYRFPRHLYSTSASRDDFDIHLAALGAGALPELGERKLGLLDLVHVPLVDAILARVDVSSPGVADRCRPHRYPLHGSSAGIGLLLTHLASTGTSEIRVLAGDYEGYAAQAANVGLACRPGTLDELAAGEPATWFVSNPSAVDGEPLDAGVLDAAASRHRLVVDVAYSGLAGSAVSAAVPEGAWAVLWSLSKPWGLFWRRVGVLACADEIGCAYGTRWFKDPERLAAALVTVSRFTPHTMADRYRDAQLAAVELLADAGVPATPSSTLLLALVQRDDVPEGVWAELARCERVPGSGVARVCLTPLIEDLIAAAG